MGSEERFPGYSGKFVKLKWIIFQGAEESSRVQKRVFQGAVEIFQGAVEIRAVACSQNSGDLQN